MISSQKFISAFIRVNWMHWTALHWHSSYVLLGILAFNTHPDMRSEYDIYIYFWFGFRRPVPHGLALFRLSSPYIRILFFYFEYILWLTLSLFRHFEFGHSVHSSLFRAGSFFAFCVEKILFLVPHSLSSFLSLSWHSDSVIKFCLCFCSSPILFYFFILMRIVSKVANDDDDKTITNNKNNSKNINFSQISDMRLCQKRNIYNYPEHTEYPKVLSSVANLIAAQQQQVQFRFVERQMCDKPKNYVSFSNSRNGIEFSVKSKFVAFRWAKRNWHQLRHTCS